MNRKDTHVIMVLFEFTRETAPCAWSSEPGYNFTYLLTCQNQLDSLLEYYGYVTLQKACDVIGIHAPEEFKLLYGWSTSKGDAIISMHVDKNLKSKELDYYIAMFIRPIWDS